MARKFLTAITFLLFFGLYSCQNTTSKYVANQGMIYGTYYSIKYESVDGSDLQEDIDKELARLSKIFSHYEKESTITKINNNEFVKPEPEFRTCFKRSIEISEITGGAFDITAAPLINAWGFGPEERAEMTQEKIDSIKVFTGYQKINFNEDGVVVKENDAMQLNMSAIAKGFTCDLIGEFLERKNCTNYMVDIGGEVVAKGINDKGKIWTIGIRKPIENPFSTELNAVIKLHDRAMATSGNYMNFYEINGKRYAHTIDPSSGYPVQHSLLSATVLADDCMTADAFATAFMVIGKDAGIELASNISEIEIYFIYADDNGENQIYMSEGFREYVSQ